MQSPTQLYLPIVYSAIVYSVIVYSAYRAGGTGLQESLNWQIKLRVTCLDIQIFTQTLVRAQTYVHGGSEGALVISLLDMGKACYTD